MSASGGLGVYSGVSFRILIDRSLLPPTVPNDGRTVSYNYDCQSMLASASRYHASTLNDFINSAALALPTPCVAAAQSRFPDHHFAAFLRACARSVRTSGAKSCADGMMSRIPGGEPEKNTVRNRGCGVGLRGRDTWRGFVRRTRRAPRSTARCRGSTSAARAGCCSVRARRRCVRGSTEYLGSTAKYSIRHHVVVCSV